MSENSENEYTGPRSSWPGPEQGPVPARPPLRRDRRSKMIAGVCGGLGRHLDVDPVIFRILFALLTFFGGFGLLLYAAAWLFVPEDDQHESEGRKLLSGGRGTFAAVAVAVLVALGFMVMITVLNRGFGHAIPLLLLSAAIIAALSWLGEGGRRRPPGEAPYGNGGRGGSGGTGSGSGGWGPTGSPDQPQPWWQRPVPNSPTTPGAPTSPTPPDPQTSGAPAPGDPSDAVPGTTEFPTPGATGFSVPHSSGFATAPGAGEFSTPGAGGFTAGWPPASGFTADWPAAEPTSGRAPRRVGGLALSGALLALGLVGVLAETGAISFGWTEGLALAVMAVGAGTVIGGWFGRARALIPLGLVLSVPLILASAVGVPLHGETGNLTWTPASAADISSPYQLAAGHGELDLSAVDPKGGTMHVTAYVGAGQMIVTVPDDVVLVVNAHVGVGRMQFTDGSMHSGLDVTKTFHSVAWGPSEGTIVLDLKAGAGDVEVHRAG